MRHVIYVLTKELEKAKKVLLQKMKWKDGKDYTIKPNSGSKKTMGIHFTKKDKYAVHNLLSNKRVATYEGKLNEGPSYEYANFVKKIDKQRDQVGRETLKLVDLLRKKGLHDASDELLNSYKDNVIKFGKDLKQLIRKLV